MTLHTGSHGGGTLPLNCREKISLTWLKTRAANTFLETPGRFGVFFIACVAIKRSGTVKNRSNLFIGYIEILLF